MKSIAAATALLSALLIADVSAFYLKLPTPTPTTLTFKTLLNYNIVAPPDDDNCEMDGSDCEESIFDRKRREKKDEQDNLREKFAENGLDLSEIDRAETLDQYQNMAGGGIIPGVQLSALMEDD